MALLKLFLVALVTTAALWTAAEAYVVDEAETSRPSVEPGEQTLAKLEEQFCAPPATGLWMASDGLVKGATYTFEMSAVSENVYNGTGSVRGPTVIIPPPSITLVAQFNETTCVFAGSIIMEDTTTMVSFLWSVIDSTTMVGPGLLTINGILDSTTPRTLYAAYSA